MSRKKVIFRADGSPKIGMGHYVRSLALAEMLKEKFQCIYATQQPTDWQVNEINKVCSTLIELPADDNHYDVFLSHLQGEEIIVLDNYYFSTTYQKAIKKKGCKLVCIDDVHDKHFVADIVINHAAGIKSDAYSVEPYTRLLLGYSYALLRKEFLKENVGEEDKRYSVLINMGGADPRNITNKVIRSICSVKFSLPIAVVIATNHSPMGKPIASNNVRVFERLCPKDICSLMRKSIFGILPASTVAIEACAVRIPFIAGYYVDNQEEAFENMCKLNLALCYGDLNNLNMEFTSKVMQLYNNKKYRKRICSTQKLHLDKRSPERLVSVMMEL